MYAGGSSSSDEEETPTTSSTNHQSGDKEEELVTRLQLRLSASHLPRVGRLNFTRRSPDTFATVTSIFHKDGARASSHQMSSSSYSFDSADTDEDYMVEWGSTEVIRNSKSPQWIKTIPLKYEYGSECFFYVRILQPAGGSETRKSPKGASSDQDLSPLSRGSDDGSYKSGGGTPEKDKSGHVFGTALFEVGDLLGSRNYTKVKRLKAGGCVYARVEPIQDQDEQKLRFRFQFQALNLVVPKNGVGQRLGMIGSEPTTVLEIARPHDSPSLTSWITVFRSRPVIHSNNPCWDLAEIDLESCCRNDDMSGVVRLSVYRVTKGHKQTLVGFCETTMHNIFANVQNTNEEGCEKDFYLQKNMRQLQQVGSLRVKVACLVTQSGRLYSGPLSQSSSSSALPSSPLSASQRSTQSSPASLSSPISITRTDSLDSNTTTTTNGEDDPFNVDLRQMSVRCFSAIPTAPTATAATVPAITLHDFIDSGGQLEFSVAIDFTSSNGNPLQPGTLHFQSDEALNDYEETITSIGNAIDKYNTSSTYCVWGFGAKFAGDGVVRHLFQCGQEPTVQGVEGILDAYRSVFRSGGIYMSGPTVFVKAIQAAAVRARKYKMAGANNTYTILLIVTDGIMDSFEETKEKLSIYGEVPLSVVIVGVGRHDFQSMYALCGNTATTRKNTTFVEFRNHQHDPRSLAQTALSQIPQQLSEYMIQNGIQLPTIQSP